MLLVFCVLHAPVVQVHFSPYWLKGAQDKENFVNMMLYICTHRVWGPDYKKCDLQVAGGTAQVGKGREGGRESLA